MCPSVITSLGFETLWMANQFDVCDGADPRVIVPVMPDLLSAIKYVAGNQKLFDADEHIYGNFLVKRSRIQTLYAPYSSLNR